MTEIIIFISIIILFIALFIYYGGNNIIEYINRNSVVTYTSLPESQQIKKKHSQKLIKNSSVDCNNGCPTNKNDNKLFQVYTSFHDERHLNKVLNKKKNASPIGPANIFIMRHGERKSSVLQLDCNGIYRSSYVTNLIEEINKLGYGIDYIVTTNPYSSNTSMHLQQTVFAVSWLLDIPLFIFGSEKESQLAVYNIYNDAVFNNKNILFCWEHTCIQQLLLNIIEIGTSKKNIPNKAFINKQGTLSIPYWDKNNFQSIIHLDEEFNDTIYSSGVKTCFQKDNNNLILGKQQTCSGNLPGI